MNTSEIFVQKQTSLKLFMPKFYFSWCNILLLQKLTKGFQAQSCRAWKEEPAMYVCLLCLLSVSTPFRILDLTRLSFQWNVSCKVKRKSLAIKTKANSNFRKSFPLIPALRHAFSPSISNPLCWSSYYAPLLRLPNLMDIETMKIVQHQHQFRL